MSLTTGLDPDGSNGVQEGSAPPADRPIESSLSMFDRVQGFAGRTIEFALGVAMPSLCLGCHKPLASRDAVCSECWQQISFIRPPLCDRLGRPMPFDTGGTMISAAAQASPPVYGKARAVAHYDGVMRQLIHDFKFRDRLEARVLFGRWLAHAGAELICEADIIAPVPLNRWRLLARRFNQSAILAREISKHHSPAFEPHILVRTRRTKSQVGLSLAQRKKNVAGAFQVPRRRVKDVEGANVLLIDDVITTGATVDACARALLKAGAGRVDVLSLALVTSSAQMTT